jgi:hypothetical protein
MADTQEVRGIGGWLAVFLAFRGVAIVLPFVQLYALYAAFLPSQRNNPDLSRYLIQSAIPAVIFAACNGFIVWRFLRRRSWRTVQIGIALIWAMTVIPWLISLARGIIPGRGPFGPGFILLLQIAGPVIWTAYLLRSKRVANTYDRHGRDEAPKLASIFE